MPPPGIIQLRIEEWAADRVFRHDVVQGHIHHEHPFPISRASSFAHSVAIPAKLRPELAFPANGHQSASPIRAVASW
ncbi:hypothetical protein SDC9_149374 [bioreactor metagenome]|uniref:Uncharacterized protein n=1 Tax=bioreactor metagenome TaxID=1076179 RepID=A0A645EJK6_9ZZZZ